MVEKKRKTENDFKSQKVGERQHKVKRVGREKNKRENDIRSQKVSNAGIFSLNFLIKNFFFNLF